MCNVKSPIQFEDDAPNCRVGHKVVWTRIIGGYIFPFDETTSRNHHDRFSLGDDSCSLAVAFDDVIQIITTKDGIYEAPFLPRPFVLTATWELKHD